MRMGLIGSTSESFAWRKWRRRCEGEQLEVAVAGIKEVGGRSHAALSGRLLDGEVGVPQQLVHPPHLPGHPEGDGLHAGQGQHQAVDIAGRQAVTLAKSLQVAFPLAQHSPEIVEQLHACIRRALRDGFVVDGTVRRVDASLGKERDIDLIQRKLWPYGKGSSTRAPSSLFFGDFLIALVVPAAHVEPLSCHYLRMFMVFVFTSSFTPQM